MRKLYKSDPNYKQITDLAVILEGIRSGGYSNDQFNQAPLNRFFAKNAEPTLAQMRVLMDKLIRKFAGATFDGEILLMAFGLLKGYEGIKLITHRRNRFAERYLEMDRPEFYQEYLTTDDDSRREKILKDVKQSIPKSEKFRIAWLAEYIVYMSDEDIAECIQCVEAAKSFTPAYSSYTAALPVDSYVASFEASQDTAQTDFAHLSQEDPAALEDLNISAHCEKDIERIGGYKNLRHLTLATETVKDFSPLAELTRLETLRLFTTGLRDLTVFGNLKNLRCLQLMVPCDSNGKNTGVNHISDIRVLSGLIHLRELTVVHGGLRDLSPLTSLKNLEWLQLSNNDIYVVPDLSHLVNLRFLSLAYNHIEEVPDLTRLTNLQELYLSFNRIMRAPSLHTLRKLQVLNLSGNQIRELPDLSHLSGLRVLSLAYNQLEAVPGLTSLTNLQELYLGHNQMKDVPDLSNLTKLKTLNLNGNPMKNIPSLTPPT